MVAGAAHSSKRTAGKWKVDCGTGEDEGNGGKRKVDSGTGEDEGNGGKWRMTWPYTEVVVATRPEGGELVSGCLWVLWESGNCKVKQARAERPCPKRLGITGLKQAVNHWMYLGIHHGSRTRSYHT